MPTSPRPPVVPAETGAGTSSLADAEAMDRFIDVRTRSDKDIALATDPQRLDRIRREPGRNRLTKPLFDTHLFTRRIEEAYARMRERYAAGLPRSTFTFRPYSVRSPPDDLPPAPA
jgi:hypothetical protein